MTILGFHRIEAGRWAQLSERLPLVGRKSIEWAWRPTNPAVGTYREYDGDGREVRFFALGFLWLWFATTVPYGGDPVRKGWELTLNHWYRWFGDPDSDGYIFDLWREDLIDWLCGPTVFAEQRGRETKFLVEMPEGNYEAVGTFVVRIWARQRWPFRRFKKVTDIHIPNGVPFAGKGENSWDQGDDGLFGTGIDGHDIAKAAAHVRRAVLEKRARYGNPSKYHPVGSPNV